MKRPLIVIVTVAAGVTAAVLAMTAWVNHQDRRARLRAGGRR